MTRLAQIRKEAEMSERKLSEAQRRFLAFHNEEPAPTAWAWNGTDTFTAYKRLRDGKRRQCSLPRYVFEQLTIGGLYYACELTPAGREALKEADSG